MDSILSATSPALHASPSDVTLPFTAYLVVAGAAMLITSQAAPWA